MLRSEIVPINSHSGTEIVLFFALAVLCVNPFTAALTPLLQIDIDGIRDYIVT